LTGKTSCGACGAGVLRAFRVLRRGERLLRCLTCGHIQLDGFRIRSGEDEFAGVDPESYRRSMWPERSSAARRMVADLLLAKIPGPLLDVGCSFGWLVREAAAAGIEAYGIDPSTTAVESAKATGLAVRRGFFPDEDWGRQDWGAIAFMDVLEHIPDLDGVLTAAIRRLRPGGFIAIQVPVSTGAVFQTALMLERISGGALAEPLGRMLQLEFPYPHVHYFCRRSLDALLSRFGFCSFSTAHAPIATGNFADRVSWNRKISPGQRLEAAGLAAVVAVGRVIQRSDLLRVVAGSGS
jgi:SAM-dependent methyltransferase